MEWPHAASVGDPAMLVNNVEPLRPGGVGEVGGVAHIIDPKGKRIFLPLHEILCDGHALLQSFRLRVADVFLHIGFHLPFIGGMRLAHVDCKKVRAIFIVVVNLDHVADVAPERRSSVTAKNYDERARTRPFAEMKMTGTV